MTEAKARRTLKEAGYSLRKERGGEGYMIIQNDINAIVGGANDCGTYRYTLDDVTEFIELYCQ